MDYIEERDIRIGDWVKIRKAGDIIPEIAESIPEKRSGNERPFIMPEKCPECGADVVREEGESCLQVYRYRVSCPAL